MAKEEPIPMPKGEHPFMGMTKIQLHAATPPRRDRMAISLDPEDTETVMEALKHYRFKLQMKKETENLLDCELRRLQKTVESIDRIMYYIKCSNIKL